MAQQQFLDVIDRDEAERRFREAIDMAPLEAESIPLADALGRVLANDVQAEIDVPSFDRSNYDGYAVQAADTYGAREEVPRRLSLDDEVLATGVVPRHAVEVGTATAIATGGMLPRGADAVVMVEHTETENQILLVTKAVTPGFGVSFTGSDITRGETILWRGQTLTSRETGVLAAIGNESVSVWRRPKVAIFSSGDEIIPPGKPMRPGLVYDSNARILADAVRELGGEPMPLGIVADNLDQLRERLQEALSKADLVLLSGGTSKGAGDLSYHAVRELSEPGIVAHGVALKPGKPICLAAHRGKAVVILPGFPTSAIFTFHEFVAPVIRQLAGQPPLSRSTCEARLAVKVNSQIGRTEYLLVGLVEGKPVGGEKELAAYPMGKGSGSVTTFSRADGFVTIDRHQEIVEAGTKVVVQQIGHDLRLADLIVIGSHCVGLDYLLGRIQELGLSTKFLAVGSTGGLQAAARGECDLAGIHLLDPESGLYNRPFLGENLELVEGYRRLQGVLFRRGDRRFEDHTALEAIEQVKDDPECIMVSRNQGSGTRILIDRLLQGSEPVGYAVQVKSHHAVAAAIEQGRAEWGIAIQWVAQLAGLSFLPLEEEHYDWAVPRSQLDRPAVVAFRKLLHEPDVQKHLRELGFLLHSESL